MRLKVLRVGGVLLNVNGTRRFQRPTISSIGVFTACGKPYAKGSLFGSHILGFPMQYTHFIKKVRLHRQLEFRPSIYTEMIRQMA